MSGKSYAAAVTEDLPISSTSLVPRNGEQITKFSKPKSTIVTIGENGENKSPINKPPKDDFKTVNRRRRRKPEVLGKNTSSNLKGVAKMASIYLSRLDAGSTTECVNDHLKQSGFKNFDVKLGYSKYPELYKSFIITVPETDIAEIKKPELWPEGACVSNFLYHLMRNREKPKPQETNQELSS